MTTITHRRGSADTLIFRPEQPDGTMPDLAGAAMQLRLQAGPTCVALDGVPDGDGFAVALAPLDLPPRPYPASVYYDWGAGWRHHGDMTITIEGGC